MIKNKRELIELAAKAAGIDLAYWSNGFEPYSSGVGFVLQSNRMWNPLDDDGDAQRLAVKLGILVGPNAASSDPMVFAWARESGGVAQYELSGTDPCAATRRAIVRAAAEIGKKLP